MCAEIDYKTCINELGRILESAEWEFYNDIPNPSKINSNSKKISPIIKEIINRNLNNNFKLSGGFFTNEKTVICNIFNESFYQH